MYACMCVDTEDNQWKSTYTQLSFKIYYLGPMRWLSRLKALASKSENPSLIPRTLTVEGEN